MVHMKKVFVDTNYFLRYLIKDVPAQSRQVSALFKKGMVGEVALVTSVIVFFEVSWVLSSYYGFEKDSIVKALGGLSSLDFLTIDFNQRDLFLEALDLYASVPKLDLEDCFVVVSALGEGCVEVASFDRDLLRVFSRGE
ncbi:PIN domain-containing protein [candidate division WWE3 bacterium]|nr:PIN domain-containing protein [candidate division WWE3 bacterium]